MEMKNIAVKTLQKVDNLVAAIVGTIGATFGTQFVEFYNQYVQNFEGFTNGMENAKKYVKNPETLNNLNRHYELLRHNLYDLTHATHLDKAVEFVENLNYDVLKGTLHQYHPALNFTDDTLLYAGIGLVTAYLLYEGAKVITTKVAKKGLEKIIN